jgi:hypothetical protein
MPLKKGNPPPQASAILSDGLRDLTPPHMAMESLTKVGMTAQADEPPQTDAPLEVFSLGLDDVIEKDLSKAKATGWRYTVSSQEQPFAAAEIDALGGDELQFSHLNTGPFVLETVNTLKQAEGLEAAIHTEYEARILKIPALYVMALWMHSDGDDILIPMPPTNDNLNPKQPYSPADFFAALVSPAKSRLDFDTNPRREPTA